MIFCSALDRLFLFRLLRWDFGLYRFAFFPDVLDEQEDDTYDEQESYHRDEGDRIPYHDIHSLLEMSDCRSFSSERHGRVGYVQSEIHIVQEVLVNLLGDQQCFVPEYLARLDEHELLPYDVRCRSGDDDILLRPGDVPDFDLHHISAIALILIYPDQRIMGEIRSFHSGELFEDDPSFLSISRIADDDVDEFRSAHQDSEACRSC